MESDLLSEAEIAQALTRQPDADVLYKRVAAAVRAVVLARKNRSGQVLPSERILADALGLSRVTVRKAIRMLIDEGLVHQRHGSGTFISTRIEKSISNLSSFSEDMRARDLQPGTRVLTSESSPVTPQEAVIFHLPMSAFVVRMERVRLADERPLAFERVTVPAFTLPDPSRIGPSLYAAMEAAGYRPVRAVQRIRAITATRALAKALNIEVNAALLMIERSGIMADGRVVEFTCSYYRGDSYDFVTELTLER